MEELTIANVKIGSNNFTLKAIVLDIIKPSLKYKGARSYTEIKIADKTGSCKCKF